MVSIVGHSYKIAFSFGREKEPKVAAKILNNLMLQERHSHIQIYELKVRPPASCIQLKDGTNDFSEMPIKKSAAHHDGWTWKLLWDATQAPATMTLHRKFAEYFSNRECTKHIWAYMPSALMYSFRK